MHPESNSEKVGELKNSFEKCDNTRESRRQISYILKDLKCQICHWPSLMSLAYVKETAQW